ncbi:hypothetical protein ACS0TY_008438 [Phlomoides rotata]
MGILDHISDLFTVTRKSKRKPMQTVEIKVKMDCDGCERRVKNAVSSIKGAISVEINRKQSRVSVTGYVDPNEVLKRVQRTGNIRAEFWPYVKHDLTHYPYAPEAYDNEAPSGYDESFASSGYEPARHGLASKVENLRARMRALRAHEMSKPVEMHEELDKSGCPWLALVASIPSMLPRDLLDTGVAKGAPFCCGRFAILDSLIPVPMTQELLVPGKGRPLCCGWLFAPSHDAVCALWRQPDSRLESYWTDPNSGASCA